MLWFGGSVSEAIAESRRIGSLFIVYIKGILSIYLIETMTSFV